MYKRRDNCLGARVLCLFQRLNPKPFILLFPRSPPLPQYPTCCAGGGAEATAVKAGWKANAPGAAKEEAVHKSSLYPKGRTRQIAEMEKMFDHKLGPHVR